MAGKQAEKPLYYPRVLGAVALLPLVFGIVYRATSDLSLDDQEEETASSEEVTAVRDSTVPLEDCLKEARTMLSPTHRVAGFHLLCASRTDTGVHLDGFMHGQNNTVSFDIPTERFGEMRKVIQKALDIQHPVKERPQWRAFARNGVKLRNPQDLLDAGLVFVFQGGNFIWPGVQIGHKTVVPLTENETAVLETVSMVPLVFSISHFLGLEECNKIIALAEPHMEPSNVAHQDRDVGKPATEWRTSTQFWLHNGSDKTGLVAGINARIVALTNLPIEQQEESVQVLSYELTQHYDAHHDYFDPELYRNNPAYTTYLRSNRIATVFWYMSDVEEGGETVFPRFGGAPTPMSYKDCTIGLRVQPAKGKVILFYSMTPDGNVDPFSLHGGCPVIKGRKWAANKWIWSRPRSES